MEKRQMQSDQPPLAKAAGLFGGARGQAAPSQRPSWPFQVKASSKTSKRPNSREGREGRDSPAFKS